MRREAHVRFLGGSPSRGGPLPARPSSSESVDKRFVFLAIARWPTAPPDAIRSRSPCNGQPARTRDPVIATIPPELRLSFEPVVLDEFDLDALSDLPTRRLAALV